MNAIDAAAVGAAFAASLFLGLRANLLKPKISSWANAPDWVWISMIALSVTFGAAGLNIVHSGHATSREAMVYVIAAVTTLVMLLNVIVNGRRRL